MKILSLFLYRIANWRSLLVFLVLYISFPAYFLKNAETRMNELARNKVGVIDLHIGFNPQKTLDMVAAYGDAGRAYYARTEMTIDVAYPIVYAFFLGIILSLLYRGTSLAWVNVLPFLNLLLDYAENVTIVTLLKTYPEQSMLTATCCEVFKLLKWCAFGTVIVLIIAGLLKRLFKRKRT